MSRTVEGHHYRLVGCDGGRSRCLTCVEASIWITLWLACLMGMLVYLYVSEGFTAWTWLALLLLAFVSPGGSALRKAFGCETDGNEAGGDKAGLD